MYELNDEELTALIKVRHGLASGQYIHFVSPRFINFYKLHMSGFGWPDDARIFNMGKALMKFPCGTIGCIGGWLLHELEKLECVSINQLHRFTDGRPKTYALFFPYTDNNAWKYTPLRAVRAIDHYIMDKEPWSEWSYEDYG